MRTSNKILLGLIVIVFSVPFLLALSLKSKMNNGEYTIVKDEDLRGGISMHTGTFTAFKVVKVVAPGIEFLTCHLKFSEHMNYKYNLRHIGDSIMVFTSNDTLFIQYIAAKVPTNENNIIEYNGTSIHVSLPVFNNLIVDGAAVIIDSFPASLDNISVKLKNHGEIKDRTEQTQQEHVHALPSATKKEDKALQASATNNVIAHNHEEVKNTFRFGAQSPNKISLPVPAARLNDLLIFRLLL